MFYGRICLALKGIKVVSFLQLRGYTQCFIGVSKNVIENHGGMFVLQ